VEQPGSSPGSFPFDGQWRALVDQILSSTVPEAWHRFAKGDPCGRDVHMKVPECRKASPSAIVKMPGRLESAPSLIEAPCAPLCSVPGTVADQTTLLEAAGCKFKHGRLCDWLPSQFPI
jgi:hypothetical protein